MEQNKEILLPSKKYANAPDKELDIKIGLDTTESLLRIGDRDIVLDVAELFKKERNASVNYKIYGKLRMIFRNLYTGTTNYEYLNERLFLNSDGSDNDFIKLVQITDMVSNILEKVKYLKFVKISKM